jgi:hypothetical protein
MARDETSQEAPRAAVAAALATAGVFTALILGVVLYAILGG